MMRVSLDYEFTRSNEKHPRVYCAALQVEGEPVATTWLLDDPAAQARHVERLRELRRLGATFVAYASTAEARCLLALGLDPADFDWVCLHAEFRLLTNWSNRWRYGVQWMHTGTRWVQKRTRPPFGGARRPDVVHDDEGRVVDQSSPVCNLLNARFKFLGIEGDPNAKDAMRALILEDRPSYTDEERDAILAYCATDVTDLFELHDRMSDALARLLPHKHRQHIAGHQLERGRWMADIARIESAGIPIDLDAVRNLSGNVEQIIDEAKAHVAGLYPFWERNKRGEWVRRQAKFAEFIETHGLAGRWPRTKTGKFAADEDTLKDNRAIPEIDALREAIKTEKQVAWYRPQALPEFMEHVGSDARLRPYYGALGTQTGRNAARAKCFPPAQSKWLRALIRPKQGEVIISADWKSQEFAIGAVLSGDRRMMDAYRAGDVYLSFGKACGMIPEDGTRESHKHERQLAKAVVLGAQYGMAERALADSLSNTLGRKYPVAEAQRLLVRHRHTYPAYWEFVARTIRDYRQGVPLVIADGWALWPDNQNPRSAANWPIQATGALCLRRAVRRLHNAGLRVAWTLHDGVYLSSPPERAAEGTAALAQHMHDATVETIGDGITIGIDTHVHHAHETWIEDGAEAMFARFGRYLTASESLLKHAA